MRYKNIFIIVIMVVLFTKQVFAWDKDVVHTLINKRAVEQSNLNSYLVGQLQSEFPNGISQTVNEKSVKTWIEEGGREEDESIFPLIGYLLRSSKHFHDPTKTWDETGWSGWWGTSLSSIYWAQSSYNEWSWQKAREYYLQALTGTTKTEREKKYGNTFEALGHVMHLVADMAVPEHTRNDTHVIAKTVEGWALNNSGELNTTATAVSDSIFQNSLIQGLTPITNLWDTYQYAGYNPSSPIGLAEYSNYNFLSHDTVFKDYEYPGKTNTFLGEPSKYTAEDGTNDNLIYYSGTTSDGISIPHLASTTYLFSEISQLSQDKYHLKATLDDRCFKDYAGILVPKAISYSTGLLNYFFRGQINMEKDPNNSSLYIIKNEYNEDMSGTFTLYYDDTNDNRRYLTSWNRSINPNSQSDSVYFTEPVSPEPKEKGKYILIFQGTLGNETGVVVGRVVEIEGCIEKGDIKIVVTADGILMQTNCRGELVKIGEISCMTYPGYERFLVSLSKGNSQFHILTTFGQNFYLYTVELGDAIIVIGENRFRKAECIDKQSFVPQSAQYSDGEPSKTLTGEGNLAGSNNCSVFTATASYTTSVSWTEAVAYQFYKKGEEYTIGNDDLPFVFEKITWSAGSQVTTTTSIIKNMIGDITGEQGDCTMSVYWQIFTRVCGYCNPEYYFFPNDTFYYAKQTTISGGNIAKTRTNIFTGETFMEETPPPKNYLEELEVKDNYKQTCQQLINGTWWENYQGGPPSIPDEDEQFKVINNGVYNSFKNYYYNNWIWVSKEGRYLRYRDLVIYRKTDL